MKTVLSALAMVLAGIATPALADDFTGPRVEARVGFDQLNVDAQKGHVAANGVTYGVAVGYDVQVIPHVIAGVDFAVDNSSADRTVKGVLAADTKRDLEASARVGVVLNSAVLAYGRLGYSNQMIGLDYKNTVAGGLRYGGGVEIALTKHIFTKAEYRVTKYDAATSSHQGLAAIGFRF